MNIKHPLNALGDGWPIWIAFIVLLVFQVFTLLKTTAKAKTDEAPWAAISLEFACSERRAKEIIGSWRREKMTDEVYRHLRWDYAFIFFYSTLTALGCVMAARAFFAEGTWAYNAALLVAWLPWVCGLLDCAENWAMHRMLGGFEGEALPRVACLCAGAKWLGIILLAVYGLAGAAVYALKGRHGEA